MSHLAKHTRAAVGHLCAHYDRSADRIGNDNIDPNRTKQNYNLGPTRDGGQVEYINQRCSEVKCHNRKDVNVMCSWVVTAPRKLSEQDTRPFFEETYKFLVARYGGEQNVVSSHVHMDEITPHMHFAFVPVVADLRRGGYKVSAKEVVNRIDLRTFHEDLEKHLLGVFGREVGILNDATKDGNRSIIELKRGQAAADLENARNELTQVQDNIKHLQSVERGLQVKLEGLKGQVLTSDGLKHIQPEKTITGAVKGISVEQVQDLKKTAVKYHEVVEQNKQLQQDYMRVKRQVPTMEERLAWGRMEQYVKELKHKLQKAYDVIERIPEEARRQIERQLHQEQQKTRRKKNRDMEL